MKKRNFGFLEGRQPTPPCCPGSRFKPEYQLCQNGNNYTLKEVGKIDIQEQIASYEDGVSLSKMIERYKRGDESALTRRKGFYADVSGMSDNPAEVISNTRALMKAASSAAPSDVAPSDAAPSDVAPSDAAPSDAAPTT